jgi:hypothetical protein
MIRYGDSLLLLVRGNSRRLERHLPKRFAAVFGKVGKIGWCGSAVSA